MLAKTYPYYLANKAQQPNTALDVFDKYSREVATRVALADAATVTQAIGRTRRGSVNAQAPALCMPGRSRTVRGAAPRTQGRARHGAVHLSRQASQGCRGRSHAADRYVQDGRRRSCAHRRRSAESRNLRTCARLSRLRATRVDWRVFVHHTVQSSVEPRRAQGRSGDRSRLPLVLKPSETTPIGALIIGEVLAGTRPPARCVLDPALPHRGGGRKGKMLEASVLEGVPKVAKIS